MKKKNTHNELHASSWYHMWTQHSLCSQNHPSPLILSRTRDQIIWPNSSQNESDWARKWSMGLYSGSNNDPNEFGWNRNRVSSTQNRSWGVSTSPKPGADWPKKGKWNSTPDQTMTPNTVCLTRIIFINPRNRSQIESSWPNFRSFWRIIRLGLDRPCSDASLTRRAATTHKYTFSIHTRESHPHWISNTNKLLWYINQIWYSPRKVLHYDESDSSLP